jgi:hypothetical protein
VLTEIFPTTIGLSKIELWFESFGFLKYSGCHWPMVTPFAMWNSHGFTSLVPYNMALVWPMSSSYGNDMVVERGVTSNLSGIQGYWTFIPSTSLYMSKNSSSSKVPESRSLFPQHNFMVKIYPPSGSMTKVYPHSKHILDLMRGVGVQHLIHIQSHDTTWDYTSIPHHHCTRRPILLGLDISSRGLRHFGASDFNTPFVPWVSQSLGVLKYQSFRTPHHVL